MHRKHLKNWHAIFNLRVRKGPCQLSKETRPVTAKVPDPGRVKFQQPGSCVTGGLPSPQAFPFTRTARAWELQGLASLQQAQTRLGRRELSLSLPTLHDRPRPAQLGKSGKRRVLAPPGLCPLPPAPGPPHQIQVGGQEAAPSPPGRA